MLLSNNSRIKRENQYKKTDSDTKKSKEAGFYEKKKGCDWCGCGGAFGVWVVGERQQGQHAADRAGNGADGTGNGNRTKIRGGGTDLATPEASGKDEGTEQEEKTEEQTGETAEHRTGDNIVGTSDKDMTEIYSTKYDKVRNDVTGKWKCLVIAENNFDVTEYALSCYRNYFDSDETVLAVINLTTKTSTSIRIVAGNLYVMEYEYVDGEEHDAKAMFGGMHLLDYIVYTDNGDIEKVTE